MTIVIGLKTKNGAMLATDCYGSDGTSSYFTPKLRSRIHCPDDELLSKPVISGVYYGTSGRYIFVDLGNLSSEIFADAPNLADLLKDEYILNHNLDEFNSLIDSLENKHREIRRTGDTEKNQIYHQLISEINNLKLKQQIRSFIESTVKSPVFSLSRIVLRISENYDPDLVLLKDGKVEDIQLYTALGSGSELAYPLLKQRYSHIESVDEALPSFIEILNSVLEDHNRFRGYQIVVANRGVDGRVEIKTAQENNAQNVKLETLCWFGPNFH
nr:hypothetical protein [Nanoarchaeum sp.]